MKLFVTDYDNTLYTSDEALKQNIQRLHLLKKKDFLIMIATGRSLPSIRQEVHKYQIPYDYLSCADGSIIYNQKEEIIWSSYLDSSILNAFQKFYQKLAYEEIQFSYDTGYTNFLKDQEKLLGINICLANNNCSQEIVDSFLQLKNQYPNYNYLYYRHTNFSYLCIKPSDVSKAYAIKMFIQKYKIPKKQVYVIGDSLNDLEMLEQYNGVRMTNSDVEIIRSINKYYDEVYIYLDAILKREM